eukprot:SAG11_NODE_1350_length_5137_cov_2.743152_4_plen_126_part_00
MGDDGQTISMQWELNMFAVAAIELTFMVVVPLLLLNLLIAMLNYSYNQIYENSERNYELERAALMYSLEGSMPMSKLLNWRKRCESKATVILRVCLPSLMRSLRAISLRPHVQIVQILVARGGRC